MLFLPSTICWHGLSSKPWSWTSPPGLPNRDMIGCKRQGLSPFSLEGILSGTEILSLIGSMNDSERIGCYDWKLQRDLIVGHEIITQTFWSWNCPLVCVRLKDERKGEQVCLVSSPHLFSTGADELHSCPVIISSHGHIPAVSLTTCHSGHAKAPTCVPLSHPAVRPLQTVSALPQLTPIPWRVERGQQGLPNLDLLCAIQPYLNPFSVCLGMSARLLPHR